MRIYITDENKLVNEIEISLTQEEAEDFNFRLNDLANNPKYKDELIRDDFIEGDVVEMGAGTHWINKSIYIFIYTKYNLDKFSKWAFDIITKEKL